MQEAKKNVILRVFFGVTCSALSVLLSGVPFYTVYRIIRLFLLASLDGAAAPTHEIWMWSAVTIGSIVLGIVLSVIGSFSCHACAFNALYDLRMRLLDHMGRLNLGFYTGGQSCRRFFLPPCPPHIQKTLHPARWRNGSGRSISSDPAFLRKRKTE